MILVPKLQLGIEGFSDSGFWLLTPGFFSPMTADAIIKLLNLKPHPAEGGFFRETYRSSDCLPAGTLPRFRSDKSVSTCIYYLLTPQTFSAMHRLQTDEIFHFYLGDPVEMLQLLPDGSGRVVTMGHDLAAGHTPQLVVEANVWQGSTLRSGGSFALMGTTVSPGFDFSDYETGLRDALVAQYPKFAEQIKRLTR